MLIQCKECGKSFECAVVTRPRTYCPECITRRTKESKLRYAASHPEKLKEKQLIGDARKKAERALNPAKFVCVVCGKEGIKHGKQKQCTGACRRKTRTDRQRGTYTPKTRRSGGIQQCSLCNSEMVVTTYNKKYCDDCQGLIASHNERKRNITKRGAAGSHTKKEFNELCDRMNWQCEYCGKRLNIKTATEDHIVPLVSGGDNHISNIAVACRSCNASKGKKPVDEFLEKKCLQAVN